GRHSAYRLKHADADRILHPQRVTDREHEGARPQDVRIAGGRSRHAGLGACTTAMSRSTSRATTVPSTVRPPGVTTRTMFADGTCALVTKRSSLPQAKPAP